MVWIALLGAGCPVNPMPPDDLQGLQGAPDLSVVADLSMMTAMDATALPNDAGCVMPSSPSGYGCDPWSAHLYVSRGAKRNGNTLRLQLSHDPDRYEGGPNDFVVPPAHQFYQTLTVDITLDQTVRDYLCVVFTAAAAGPLDASSAAFPMNVKHDPESSLLAIIPPDFMDHKTNLIDICGSSMLRSVAAPMFAMPMTVLPDVAMAIPLVPVTTAFTPGTRFTGWLARGYVGIDEESELSPAITATVVTVQ